MNKRVCPQAKREDQLRAEFQAAAACEGRSAAGVLRELMGFYVEMQRSAVGVKALRQHGLERVAAARTAFPGPGDAARHLTGEQQALDDLAARQHGWRSDSFRRGEEEGHAIC